MLQMHQKLLFPLNEMSVLNKSDAQDFLSSVKTHFLPGLKLFPYQHSSGIDQECFQVLSLFPTCLTF